MPAEPEDTALPRPQRWQCHDCQQWVVGSGPWCLLYRNYLELCVGLELDQVQVEFEYWAGGETSEELL